MLGFLLQIGSDPAQIPNNASYKTGVGVENLDKVFTLDICDDPGFPQQFVYTLDPGQWYSFSGSSPFWARITPNQANLLPGDVVTVWVNPGGAANIGGQINPASGAQAVDVVAPNPLPVQYVTPPASMNQGPSASPGLGQDFQFTVPINARVTMIQATLTTSSVVGARYPYYQINAGGILYRFTMSPTVIHRSQSWIFTGGPGLSKPYTRTGDQVVTFAFPNVFLPAGTIIGSFTGNMDANDQWYNIIMCLDLN